MAGLKEIEIEDRIYFRLKELRKEIDLLLDELRAVRAGKDRNREKDGYLIDPETGRPF